MAPIDLSKNRNEILKVHKEVSDPKSPTNWALFGYDGKTDVLTVSSKGDGGITEFIEELNAGRILYGYLKVIDPNSNLPKFVFINWQGEGVPEMIKGGRASHVREVSNLLKGAHVSINARNEDDIDEETIMSKVSKASGANYSFHKEPKRDNQPAGPVGSVYEKIKPQIEIKPVLREKFWENAAKDESTRKDAEKKRLAAEREKHDKELKERELQDAKKREERENDRFKKALEIKAANQKANAPAHGDKSAWENEQELAKKDEEERAKRSEETRKERANEAQKLIASATSQARSVFQQQPVSQFDNKPKGPPPARKLKTDFLETDNSETKPQVKPLSVNQPRAQAPAPSLPKAQVSPPSMPEMEIYADQTSIDATTVETNDDIYDDTSAVNENDDFYDDIARPAPTPPSSAVSQSLVMGLPKRVESDEEEDQMYDDIAATDKDKQEIYDDTSASADATGICAIAIYDYQAAEDNEISFDPDDKIVDIEMVDDGWWVGTTSDGKRGMFPANYVEVINS